MSGNKQRKDTDYKIRVLLLELLECSFMVFESCKILQPLKKTHKVDTSDTGRTQINHILIAREDDMKNSSKK